MPVSLEELLGATQYRSLSRTGRTTDSVSSKARLHFQQSILKRKTAAEDVAMGKKRDVNPLKLLTVSEVVDTDQEAQRLQKSIPADLQDERVDLLVSSAREHPEVERKGQYIVTLEREIAFHHAMSPFHKGVDTSASLQAADVVARKRAEAERIEQERQQHAFEEAGTKPSPPGSPLQSPSKRMKDSNKSSHSFVSERALTPSPAFASKSGRFAKPENSQAPPVGHYRPRHNVVDVAAPAPAFPKHKRVLNPVLPSSYVGDKMTMEEREQAILNMSRPGTVAASVPVSPNMKSSFIHSSEKLLSASTPPVSPKNGLAASTSPSSPTGGSMGSPCFKSPGRDTVAMTRGGAATPEPTKKGKKGRPSSPDRPDAVSDHLIRPRERGVLEMHRQLGRPPITALGMSAITDTTKMPLRTGDALFGNGAKGHALSFDAHASREQRNRCTEMKPEQLAQRFYDRSALDHIKYSRTPVHEFNRSPIRGRGDTSPTRDSRSRTGGDSHLLTGSTVPELPRTHTPGFKMELSPARRGVEIPMHDVQYEIHDDIIRPNTRQAVIAPPSSNRSPLRIQPGTTPSSPAQGLAAAPDSPVVRRKYIRDISLAKQVSREAVERITHHDKEPDPIPAERVERALNYTRPAAKALVPIGTVVSREKRDLMGSPERLTVNIDTNCGSADTSQLANLKLGYVQFGKMSDRDHQGGNKFANDIRSLTKLFEDGSQRRDRGGPVSPSNRRTRSEASPPPPASPSH